MWFENTLSLCHVVVGIRYPAKMNGRTAVDLISIAGSLIIGYVFWNRNKNRNLGLNGNDIPG